MGIEVKNKISRIQFLHQMIIFYLNMLHGFKMERNSEIYIVKTTIVYQ